MKKLLLSTVVTFSIVLGSCNDSSSSAKADNEEVVKKKEVLAENKKSVNMKVEGMVCAMGCAKHIQDEVAKQNGIVSSNVNFEEGIVMFEFDKTSTSVQEIQEFINNIHDGQYKATIANNDIKIEDEANAESEEETLGSVKSKFNISFPDLFTYFIKNIR